ncbi:DNA-binding SARP family transcriptional activator [Nakamurella sp. UYEF19]|uniref:AfsR/SARP family transcriptional regulator n=1 Tax=Nakamurella sp. UYEF19 TaxID=1756392 RepID=UPI0033973583
MTVRVRLLGRPRPEFTDEGPHPSARGRKSWAVFARIALAERPVLRTELAMELFGEADDPAAALRWALADLRRSLGRADLLRGDPVVLDRGRLEVDVWQLDAGELDVVDVAGDLLDGVELRDSPAFDTWLLLTRSHYAAKSRQQLRTTVLRLLAAGEPERAVTVAEAAARLDPLDEHAQELLLRALVTDGRSGVATLHLAACEGMFAREGLVLSPALRAAAQDPTLPPPVGVRSGVVAAALLQAGRAALDAGAADGGVETLRRAAADAERAHDSALLAEVLHALGAALVHSVRGFDGEGALVLHRGLRAARAAGRSALAADILRELAFVDIQAGRHGSALLALDDALAELAGDDEPGLTSGILALRGMNEADQGRHFSAVRLLTRSVRIADTADRHRQGIWSLGVLARSLMLSGRTPEAVAAAEASIERAQQLRWNAFLPWPEALRAECLGHQGEWQKARTQAEHAFALGCELGDPCWEGMAARVLSITAQQSGDAASAWEWIVDARRRSDRVPDRYVWVSAYVGLAQLELAVHTEPALVGALADRLRTEAVRYDLPEFQVWATVHSAGIGDRADLPSAVVIANGIDNPLLQRRLSLLTDV